MRRSVRPQIRKIRKETILFPWTPVHPHLLETGTMRKEKILKGNSMVTRDGETSGEIIIFHPITIEYV